MTLATLPELSHTKPNFSSLTYGRLTLWFSYQTLIAFRVTGKPLVIQVNEWSATTGRHLNSIDPDKSLRIQSAECRRQWDVAAPFFHND